MEAVRRISRARVVIPLKFAFDDATLTFRSKRLWLEWPPPHIRTRTLADASLDMPDATRHEEGRHATARGWKQTGEAEDVGDETGGQEHRSAHHQYEPLDQLPGRQFASLQPGLHGTQRRKPLLPQQGYAHRRSEEHQPHCRPRTQPLPDPDQDVQFQHGHDDEEQKQVAQDGLHMAKADSVAGRSSVPDAAGADAFAEATAKERIHLVVATIPAGSVSTYGDIAAFAGLPRRARLVGRTLRQLSTGSRLPWHRVVRADGRIAPRGGGEDEQQRRLEAEGIPVRGHRVDLKSHRWQP